MEKLKLHSPDLTQENIAKLAELFPNCVTEIKKDEGGRMKDEKGGGNSSFSPHPSSLRYAIDFDQLRQELSTAIVEGPQERYQLNWPGKREALLTANAPIAKTLRPCREESVDFDTTQNLFIEGDNLDALKLLQETYLNKVKMIYIDPPYNTGSDLVYNDEFKTDTDDYFARSNQRDLVGNRLVANVESNGRFHSDWLSMMYARLTLARRLLSDSGVILISIDDNEITNLRKICDEVFGSNNFVSNFVWKSKSGGANDSGLVAVDHEYVLCFAKNILSLTFRLDTLAEASTNYSQEDENGRYALERLDKQNLQYSPSLDYVLTDPDGKQYRLEHKDPKNPNAIWRWSKERVKREMGNLVFKNGNVYTKNYEKSGIKMRSLLVDERFGRTRTGRANLDALIDGAVFSNPKPVKLLQHFILTATDHNSLVLDFFAGSASTAEAIMRQNAADGGTRKYIMVQFREVCGDNSAAFKAGFGTIAEISKERIRRAGKKIKDEVGRKKDEKNQELALGDSNSSFSLDPSSLDVGFRVLKIDSSNMKDVYYAPDAVKQGDLLAQVDNIREDRTPEDLLFQVLLDWGVDLALPITQETFKIKDEGGRMKDEKGAEGSSSSFNLHPSSLGVDSSFKEYKVFFVDGNALAACFETGIEEEFVKALAARHPLRAVFRDAGFGSDSVKINIEQIFKLISPTTEVKTL